MMMLGDGELAMKNEPVNEVGQLAESAADSLAGLALGDGQSFFVALPPGGATYLFPDGEGLPRTYEQSVDMGDGQGEVGGFVLLQQHVDIAKASADEGIVAIHQDGQRRLADVLGEARGMEDVAEVALQYFFLHGETIREGRNLAK